MKRSSPTEEKGIVYLVGTPIGNLEDITYRAVSILKKSDIVACEDTRNTAVLLKHYGIRPKKLVSLYSQIEEKEGERLVKEVKEKNLILSYCSDAGMPGISDPGALLAKKCQDLSVPVTVLPGPTAALSALVLSGLDTADFSFFGFPPTKKGAMTKFFSSLKEREETLIFYESPKRIIETLSIMKEVFSGERKATIVRELTKIHEETIFGTLDELSSLSDIKGECVIVVEGAKERSVDSKALEKEIRSLLKEGSSVKDVSRLIAERHGIKKSDVYEMALAMQGKTK